MASGGPRSEVFTTVLVNELGMVADWPQHKQRMNEHAAGARAHVPTATNTPLDCGLSCQKRNQACMYLKTKGGALPASAIPPNMDGT